MRVIFLQNAHRRERMLGAALAKGLSCHGDKLEIRPYDDQPCALDCDLVAFIGVKAAEWHDWCCETGQRFLYFDKGYYYPEEKTYIHGKPVVQCWRVAVDANQPLGYLAAARHDPRRWDQFAIRPKPWRKPTADGHIILAGSSPKYHQFHGLPDPTEWAQEVVAEIRRQTDRPIHYRPKPSWWIRSPDDAVPIEGAEFIPEDSFEDHIAGAHAVVTYGSNAALIGMLAGVPSITVGNGVTRLISSTDLSDIEKPYLASEDERLQLLANLAWSQFTLREFGDGTAWAHIKQQMA